MNDVVSDAIEAYANSRVIRENIQTKDPDYSISIDKDLSGNSTLTLYSLYAGSNHIVFNNVSEDNLQAAIEQLNSLVDFSHERLL
ncbi:hypothetical protein [Calothrix sp. NIES-2100]|uniref:hypothetical protein n=1 Tax=Calothrix sp. NIES-2100 TaxID=1954172 RepID=UPI0030D96AAC